MNVTDISVVPAGEMELESISRIGNAAFRAAYAPYNSVDDLESHLAEHYTIEAIRDELVAGKNYRLAMIDDEGAGLCKFSIAASPEAIGQARSLEIEQLYVSPDIQGSGIGRALVNHAIEVASDARLDAIWLSVWEQADWAIGFYRACGFVEFGEHAFYLGESRQRDLLMALCLDTEAAS